MALDLFRIERIDTWEGINGDPTVWVVRGQTLHAMPGLLIVRTVKPWQAALCERALQTQRYVWIGWRDGRRGARDMVTVKFDDSAFVPDAESDGA